MFSMLVSYSQQIPLSSLYVYNRMMINPAETGLKKPFKLNLMHREQWLGFQGSPSTTWLTGQKKINSSMGVGGSVILDNVSFLERLSINANYSYGVKFNKEHSLNFGLSLGMLQTKFNVNNIVTDDYSDVLLTSGNTLNGIGVNAQFGMLYTFKKLVNVGISFPQMLKNKVNLSGTNQAYDLANHWIFYTSGNIKIDEQFKVVPTLLIRDANKSIRQLDFIANIKYKDKIWGGMGFRTSGGFLINAGGSISNKFGLTYNYEFGRVGIAKGTSGSHELMLSYIIGKTNLVDESQEEEIQEPTERKPSQRF